MKSVFLSICWLALACHFTNAILPGMGHRLTLGHQAGSANHEQNENAPARPTNATSVSRREGLVAGIGVIFGLFGLLYGWKATTVSP